MKRIFSLILSLVMLFALCACDLSPNIKPYGGNKSTRPKIEESDLVKPEEEAAANAFTEKDNDDYDHVHRIIASFVKENRTDLVYKMSKVYEPFLKNPCITNVEAYKHGILFNVNIVDVTDLPEVARDNLEDALHSSYDILYDALIALQKDVRELEFIIVNICEDNGNVITSIQVSPIE